MMSACCSWSFLPKEHHRYCPKLQSVGMSHNTVIHSWPTPLRKARKEAAEMSTVFGECSVLPLGSRQAAKWELCQRYRRCSYHHQDTAANNFPPLCMNATGKTEITWRPMETQGSGSGRGGSGLSPRWRFAVAVGVTATSALQLPPCGVKVLYPHKSSTWITAVIQLRAKRHNAWAAPRAQSAHQRQRLFRSAQPVLRSCQATPPPLLIQCRSALLSSPFW